MGKSIIIIEKERLIRERSSQEKPFYYTNIPIRFIIFCNVRDALTCADSVPWIHAAHDRGHDVWTLVSATCSLSSGVNFYLEMHCFVYVQILSFGLALLF